MMSPRKSIQKCCLSTVRLTEDTLLVCEDEENKVPTFDISSKSHENRLTYPLKKRQIDLLFSTLAYSAIDHVDLETKKPNDFFNKKRRCNADNF